MKIGDKINLEATAIASGGEGIARVGEEGFVVFTPELLPGEKATVVIESVKKRYATATLRGRLTKSEDRIKPRCPSYGKCGGCQLQHMSYEAQLKFKAQSVREAFERIGGIELPHEIECVASPKQWGYRNKASFPIQNKKENRLSWGYYAARSHRIIPIHECPVLEPELLPLSHAVMDSLAKGGFEGYDEMRAMGNLRYLVVRKGSHTEELLVGLVAGRMQEKREIGWMRALNAHLAPLFAHLKGIVLNVNADKGNFIWGPLFKTLSGKNSLQERLAHFAYEADISSFFQVNSEQAEQLFRYAADLALKNRPQKILELYCGGGSLTSFLASGGVSVDAVEEWRPAVRLLKQNIQQNNLTNVRPFECKAEDVFHQLKGGYDTIVLDPPRGGCDKRVLDGVLRFAPRRIVYVSCNPATLARDLVTFKEGGYRLEEVRPFDLFPQTVHVETVVSLVRA